MNYSTMTPQTERKFEESVNGLIERGYNFTTTKGNSMDSFLKAVIEKYRPHARLHASLGIDLAKFASMEWEELHAEPLAQAHRDRIKVIASKMEAAENRS